MSYRIETCGGIASGKTTLANLNYRLGLTQILESFRDNPFWLNFYRQPENFAFETEITFLLQHYSAIKSNLLLEARQSRIICDYSFTLDRAYAEVTLRDKQLDIFRSVAAQVANELGYPDLLIHLTCSPSEEFRRIQLRGRAEETAIDLGYLSKLNDSIEHQLDEISHNVTILKIDSESIDFAHDPSGQDYVVTELFDAIN